MPNRLIPLLLLAASLYASGAAIVALSNGTAVSRHVETTTANMPAVSPVAEPLDTTATLLPVVVVHPEPEMLTLATVTVRPSRADLTATVADTDEISMATLLPAGRRSNVLSFASAGFDMPYYSFGRTLRHVSKE